MDRVSDLLIRGSPVWHLRPGSRNSNRPWSTLKARSLRLRRPLLLEIGQAAIPPSVLGEGNLVGEEGPPSPELNRLTIGTRPQLGGKELTWN
jgi:hypothetical protein